MRTAISLTIVLASILFSAPAQHDKDQQSPALVQFSGPDSKIEKRNALRVLDDNEWKDLWSRHSGIAREKLDLTGYPTIDFKRCMVIAFFGGKTVNTRGEELNAADEADGTLRLRFSSRSYQSMSLSGDDQGEAAVPFGIWVLPRTEKEVTLEQNVQNVIGGTPVWKEVAKFPPVSRDAPKPEPKVFR